MNQALPERPGIFVLGSIVTALHAGLALSFLVGLGVLGSGGLGIGALSSHGEDAIGLGIASGLVGGLALMAALFYALVLYVCFKAWNGSCYGIYALVALSILGIMNSGPFSMVIGVLTVVGAIQFRDRIKEVEREVAFGGAA